ncbi:MAG: hypothetical protein CBE07_003325 [Pelagibacteraceae bacterium TMED247]|nr:MAG: hypothetical protein CBE07_003325 [Pelagibacteraceae bacterium TMED247]|tara:strand:- start:9080 stop:9292 length:213 start_codon:yes stop_codon:yes gene_type:complete
MSNEYNEQLKDSIITEVESLDYVTLMSSLSDANVTKVSKYTGKEASSIIEYAEDVLIEQKWEEALEASPY